VEDARKLRELATWYRAFAEKAANPAIWEARLQTAEDLDREAEQIEMRENKNPKTKPSEPVITKAPAL
jgi:hypothetical protein